MCLIFSGLPLVHLLLMWVERDVTSPVRGPSPLSSKVPRIICAQVLHSLSSSSPQHPADRYYLCCYYPSSNKTTLLFLFGLSGITSPQCFLFFSFSDQQPRKTQIRPNTVDSVGGSFMSSECNETISPKFQKIKKRNAETPLTFIFSSYFVGLVSLL